MPWFRVDDGFSSSKKVLRIPRRHRLAAIGLWTLAGSWASKELTDGYVPEYVIEELGGSEALARQLVAVELWSKSDDGWLFVNWDEFNPLKAQVEAERAKAAERVRKWRENKGKRQDGNGVTTPLVTRNEPVSNAVSNADVTLPPTRPDPTRPDPTPSVVKRASQLPASWQPSVKHQELADELRVDLTTEAAKFADYCHANGKTYKDHNKAFNNWLRNAKQFSGRPTRQQEVDGVYQRAMARAREGQQ